MKKQINSLISTDDAQQIAVKKTLPLFKGAYGVQLATFKRHGNMIALMDKGCDLVNGTRYKHGGKNAGGVFISRLLSTTANNIFHVLSGSSLTDPTFGVKMFKRAKFNELSLESKPVGWAVSFEFAIKAQAAGWKLGEVPLISLNRLYGKGKSTFRLNWVREYMKWFLFGITRLWLRKKNKVIVKIPENLRD